MPFTIHKEAPKVKLVTMGQADKEIEMAKVSYETHPELYQLRPGTTEPELKNPEAAGVSVISEEPASKAGPVGAKGEPRKVSKEPAKKK